MEEELSPPSANPVEVDEDSIAVAASVADVVLSDGSPPGEPVGCAPAGSDERPLSVLLRPLPPA